MSYQMIHMEIAYRLLQQLPVIQNKAEFILGAVAPDSVHMNPDYKVAMKVKSHMFEGCGKWGDTQDYERWERNIKGFFCENAIGDERTKYRDFSLGMCVHCLTDYWNDIKIWKRLRKEYIPAMEFEEFKSAYYAEARESDLYLYQHGENTEIIRSMLLQAEAVEIKGIVAAKEVSTQKNHLLTVQYAQPYTDISDHVFLREETVEEFVSFTVREIKNMIKLWQYGRCCGIS